MPRAFVVYSSKRHVPYIEDVMEVIDKVLKSLDIEPYYLSHQIRGGLSYPPLILEMITQSDMGIVVLDGLRPNVAFEYGLLSMRNIDIIPLKKSDAKLSIKSLYYNPTLKNLDPSLAFGDFYFKKAALEKLKDPLLDVNIHFSDCQGKHIVEFDAINDTNEINSLATILRGEIKKIIPKLRSRDGPGFERLHILFADLNIDLMDESIKLLSLFSFLGWRQEFEGDTRFQSIREGFLSLLQNEQASIEKINTIFEALVESDVPILRKYGRYLTVDSDNLISESFEYLLLDKSRFNNFFSSIINSDLVELKIRFIERISTRGILNPQRVRDIGKHIFSRSGLFQDISVLRDRERSRLLSRVGYLYPSGALDLLSSWITPLSPNKIAEMFPFQSTLFLPGNPQDDVLWFLNETSKNNNFFTQSMDILFKFSVPIIVEEEQHLSDLHFSVRKLALDRYLEQCYSLSGEVEVSTRWNYIQNLVWSEDWSEDYIKATKILKFRAIQTFLQKSWSITGSFRDGALQINHTTIIEGQSYDELENCRAEAYQILLEWLNQPVEYAHIYESLFDYFYRNLSEWVKYIPWDQIKSLFERIFRHDSKKKLIFINHIDLLRAFNNQVWQGQYSGEQLSLIFQFQEELEERLTTLDFYRRNMRLWVHDIKISSMFPDQSERENYVNNLQSQLMNRYIEMDDSDRVEITKLLLIENHVRSYKFGTNLKNHLSIDEIKSMIKKCLELIERYSIEKESDFFHGLWNALFTINEEEWENFLENNWNKSHIQLYLNRILWPTGNLLNDFRWVKYQKLFELRQIEPVRMIEIIHYKEIPPSVFIGDKILLLITAINHIGEKIESEDQYPVDFYLNFIWRLESLLSKNEDLLREDLAERFLETFFPIRRNVISQLSNTDILIKFGRLSRLSFNNWLKAGFQASRHRRDDFLIKCADEFIDEIFHITQKLFSIPQEGGEMPDDYDVSYSFRISGNPKILLKFTADQIDSLYELNSPMLGSLLGRLIRNSSSEEIFPEILKRLIIQHNKDIIFRNKIFQEFSIGIRTFGGNNYDQSYDGDYAKLSRWRDSATNDIFREWLQELHHHIDALKKSHRDMWREKEVE